MKKYINVVIGLLIILAPSLISKEFFFLSNQFYPSGITFVVGVDYALRVACFVAGLIYMNKTEH